MAHSSIYPISDLSFATGWTGEKEAEALVFRFSPCAYLVAPQDDYACKEGSEEEEIYAASLSVPSPPFTPPSPHSHSKLCCPHTNWAGEEEGVLGDKMGKARRSAEFIARRFFGSHTSHLPSDFMFVPPPFPQKNYQRSNLISLLLSGTRALMKCCKDDPIYFCSPLLLCCQDLGQLSEGGGDDGRNRQIIFCEEADRPILLLLLICAL